MYSCDAEDFARYMKENTTYPMSKFDQNLNIIEPIITTKEHINHDDSFSGSSYSNNTHESAPVIKDLCELWVVNPHPPNSAQVKFVINDS